ncbi:hypothetical protein ACU4GD_15180 [Cupriavidus basilensis]
MMEICLGTRPRDERAFAASGEPYYRELATIDALAYRRMLDRVFWHPPADLLRFEVQATPSGQRERIRGCCVHAGCGYALVRCRCDPWSLGHHCHV